MKEGLGMMKAGLLGLVLASWTCSLPGEEIGPGKPVPVREQAPMYRNQFGLNYRLGVNMAVDFKRLGGFDRQTDPGPATGGGINRTYDDGFNYVDSSGNMGGYTWYWGYENSSQAVGSSALVMNSSASYDYVNKNDVDEGTTHGVELTYRRDLNALWRGRWGVEGAFAFTSFSVSDNNSYTADVTVTTDNFVLNGVLPPMVPYQGTFMGPGPVISDSPQRTMSRASSSATISGEREFDADLYWFRVGPYWEVPLAKRVAVSLSGGLSFGVVDNEFSYHETVAISGVGTQSRSASNSETDFLVGAYLAGEASYSLSERVRLTLGVQWQYMGDYNNDSDGKEAVADFDDSIFITFGVGYSF